MGDEIKQDLEGKMAVLKLQKFYIPMGEFLDREYSCSKLAEIINSVEEDKSEYPIFGSRAIEALKNALDKKREADFWIVEAEFLVWHDNPGLDLEEAKAKEFADNSNK